MPLAIDTKQNALHQRRPPNHEQRQGEQSEDENGQRTVVNEAGSILAVRHSVSPRTGNDEDQNIGEEAGDEETHADEDLERPHR